MKKTVCLVIVAGVCCLLFGCTSKLVRIDSKPAFADVLINDEPVGKTPMYYRFYDKWHPWPSETVDDYVIYASYPGYRPDVQIFQESPEVADISYVPDEIFFNLKPVQSEEIIETGSEEYPDIPAEENTDLSIEENTEMQSEEGPE